MLLSLTRLRVRIGVFAALLGVVALISGIGVAVIGSVAASASEGVRIGLDERTGSNVSYRVGLRLAEDPAAQDAAVREAVERTFEATGGSLTVDRVVDVRMDVTPLRDDGEGSTVRAHVASIAGIADRARIVDGRWPEAGEVAVLAAAAELLDLAPGDRLLLDELEYDVVGTWEALDHLDPRWFGDTLVTEGVDHQQYGLVLIDEGDWSSFPDLSPRARWTLIPETASVTPDRLADYIAAWSALPFDWRGTVPESATMERQGGFSRTASALLRQVDGLRAIEPVALLLLAAAGILTLAELARLLAASRSEETALLWARGASPSDVSGTTAIEATIAAVPGAALGAGAAAGALALVDPEGVPAAGAALWLVPLATAIAAIAIVAVVAHRSASRAELRPTRAGRVVRVAGPGSTVLVVAAAGVSIWQLRLYGSPVAPAANGGSAVDPIAVVAPALGVLAVVLIGLFVAGLLARRLEQLGGRARATTMLAARGVARRLPLVAAPIVAVALAVGSVGTAAAFAGTWGLTFDRTAELSAGADVHVRSGPSGIPIRVIDEIASRPQVAQLAAVHVETLSVGSENGVIVAATPHVVEQFATTASGVFDRAVAAEAMRVDLPGPAVPADATELRLGVSATGFAIPPDVLLRVSDADGVMRAIPFDAPVDVGADPTAPSDASAPAARLLEYTAEIDAGVGPWQVLAIEVSIESAAVVGTDVARFQLTGLDADGEALDLEWYWVPETPELAFMPPTPTDGQGFFVEADTRLVRMVPSFDGAFSDAIVAPAVITRQLADDVSAELGDRLSFPLEDTPSRITAEVTAIVPVIPSADDPVAMLLDLGIIQHYQLRVSLEPPLPEHLWIATDDAETVIADARPLLPANVRLTSADDPGGRTVLGAAATGLWLAAWGCLVLGAVAVAAAVRVGGDARRADVAVLRALGLSAREQSGIRSAELGLVLGFGAVVGALAAVLVAVLTVPALVRAAVPEAFGDAAGALTIDVVGLGAAAAVLAGALAVIVAVAAGSVAALARRTTTEDLS